MVYDLIIIGGGPAGAAAGVYAGRKKMKTLLITESFGGQSVVSDSVENWIGTKKITGLDLARMLEEHLRVYNSVEIKMPEKIFSVKKMENGWEITTDKNNTYQAKTLIVASGGRRKRLNVPGEEKFNGKGISYCSTCDAPIFRGKNVAVIGGGNAGAEAAIDLLPYASKVYLINIGPEPKADPATINEIKKSSQASIINNAITEEILGDKFVNGIKYLDKASNESKILNVEGIFVEVGSMPNSEFIRGLVETNGAGEIVVDHKTGAASRPGIFAAGDVTDEIYKQNNISAGDGIAAALSAYNYLLNIKKQSPSYE